MSASDSEVARLLPLKIDSEFELAVVAAFQAAGWHIATNVGNGVVPDFIRRFSRDLRLAFDRYGEDSRKSKLPRARYQAALNVLARRTP